MSWRPAAPPLAGELTCTTNQKHTHSLSHSSRVERVWLGPNGTYFALFEDYTMWRAGTDFTKNFTRRLK